MENQDQNTNTPKPGMKMNPMMIGAAVVVVVVIAVGALFFARQGGDGDSMMATPTSSPAGENTMNDNSQMQDEGSAMHESTEGSDQAMMEGDTAMSDVKEFTLEAGSYYYKPNIITVKKGDKVKVTINAVDKMHDFVVDEFNAKTDIVAAGKSASVEFTADKAGSYEFYCSVANHRAQGMVGTLIVE